jgi:[ribosomal protein S5]-alanine N-acetyltransferase
MVTLNTKRLILREFTKNDFESVHIYASDPEVVKYMPWGPNTPLDTRRFLEKAIQSRLIKPRISYELAITINNLLIGGCGITIKSSSDKLAEIGYCIRRDYWGIGIGTETAAELIKFGFQDLSMHKIIAKCDARNIPSYRVMEKNNMKHECTLRDDKFIRGEWRDSYLYNILDYEWLKV